MWQTFLSFPWYPFVLRIRSLPCSSIILVDMASECGGHGRCYLGVALMNSAFLLPLALQ